MDLDVLIDAIDRLSGSHPSTYADVEEQIAASFR